MEVSGPKQEPKLICFFPNMPYTKPMDPNSLDFSVIHLEPWTPEFIWGWPEHFPGLLRPNSPLKSGLVGFLDLFSFLLRPSFSFPRKRPNDLSSGTPPYQSSESDTHTLNQSHHFIPYVQAPTWTTITSNLPLPDSLLQRWAEKKQIKAMVLNWELLRKPNYWDWASSHPCSWNSQSCFAFGPPSPLLQFTEYQRHSPTGISNF